MVNPRAARGTHDTASAHHGVAEAEPRGRIVFADDDPMVLHATTSALTTAGFEVTTVSSAAQALPALEGQFVDALLIDIDMPGNQNLELLHALSKDKPLIPVVILTGRPTLDTAVRAVR